MSTWPAWGFPGDVGSVTWAPTDAMVVVVTNTPDLEFQKGTGYLLAVAGAAARRRWVEGLAGHGVTPSQFKVVMSLRDADSLSQGRLAEVIGVDPRNCVAVVDALVGADLVSRTMDPTDRRRRDLRLTEKGRALATTLDSLNTEIEQALMRPLSAKDRSTLHRLLVTVLGSSG